MSNIAVVTDSNSGISQQEAKELGIQVLPMPFFVNNVLHFEDIDLTQMSSTAVWRKGRTYPPPSLPLPM